MKILFKIICILYPRARVPSLDRRVILGEDRHNIVAAPDLITGTQVGKHLVGGPFTDVGSGM